MDFAGHCAFRVPTVSIRQPVRRGYEFQPDRKKNENLDIRRVPVIAVSDILMIAEQNGGRYDPDMFITSIAPDRAKDILLHLWKNREDLRSAIILAKVEIEFDSEQ